MIPQLTPHEYNRFYVALRFVLESEGGYVCDPSDAGGETKWGISKKAYPNEDIPHLTAERATEIYFRDYWRSAACDTLKYPDCVVVFDAAVNMGVHASLGIYEDAGKDWQKALELRKEYYAKLVKKKPTNQKFLAGWLNRVQRLKKYLETTEMSAAQPMSTPS